MNRSLQTLGQKNEQNPQFWDKKMSRLGQKNEQGLFTTHCNTGVYGTKNRLEIISEILRNNLVILEIEKRAQKLLDFWSVSLSLRYNLHHNSYIINNPNHVEL